MTAITMRRHRSLQKFLVLLYLAEIWKPSLALAWSHQSQSTTGNSDCRAQEASISRRHCLYVVGTATVLSSTFSASAASPVEGLGGRLERVPEAGAGNDLFTLTPGAPDAVYPPSLVGTWNCQRGLLSVEGDAGQAQDLWMALGGTKDDYLAKSYSYQVKYIESPKSNGGVIRDRGFVMSQRLHRPINDIQWDPASPDKIVYDDTELVVVSRQVEPVSDAGWGSNELFRVTNTRPFKLVKAARVKRRFRRAYTDSGDRSIEGLELQKTYRVLDGIAGELPTSTIKSRILLTRE